MKIFKFIIFIALLAMYSCQPENVDLGSVLSADELQYSVTQDSDDPNMVYLESKTDGVTPLWQTSLGHSTDIYDTLKIPFAGDYYVVYGVETPGGYVESTDTVFISLTTNNFNYVDDDLWTYLTGGVGNSKTWIADNGAYGLASGPLSYADPSGTVEWNDFTPNWDPSGSDIGIEDDDELYESTMTFSLIDGAIMTTNKVNEGVEEDGTYMLDVDNHTLSTYDATIIRPSDFIENASNWTSDLNVLTLDENQLQIAIMRTNDEGSWWYILNYVSKDYADSYEGDDEVEEPDLPDGWEDDISAYTTHTIKWVLSAETPFNWANLDGSLMNTDWTSPADYPDWTGFDSSVPDSYANFSLEMNSETGEVVYTDPDGNSTSGTYTLDDDGIYTFEGVTPYFLICSSWVYLTTTDDNQWRILDLVYESGALTGMWVGVYDEENSQYMCYLLEPEVGGSSSSSSDNELSFDNSKMMFGDLEEKGNYRIELYNEYGDGTTLADPPFTLTDFSFSNSFEITFTLSGITFNDGAVGSYQTAVSYASADWACQYWGDGTGDGEVAVTGDGTYTVTCAPGASGSSAVVFVVDILNMATDIADMDAVTCTVDKIVMY